MSDHKDLSVKKNLSIDLNVSGCGCVVMLVFFILACVGAYYLIAEVFG